MDEFKLQVMLIIKSKDPETQVKRAKYSDGYAPKKFKLGGVKRLFYVGLLPFSQESRHNVRVMLQAINLYKVHLPTAFSLDMKLALYLNMKQDGSCKHSCIFCTSSAPWLEKGC